MSPLISSSGVAAPDWISRPLPEVTFKELISMSALSFAKGVV